MKDQLILHVGMHKTATKTIQSALSGYVDENSLRYASMGKSNHSIALLTAFYPNPHKHYFYVTQGKGKDEVEAMRRSVRKQLIEQMQTPERNIVFSAEELTLLSAFAIQDMKNFLGEFCENFRIIAYIRDPVSLASSLFQQLVRHSRTTHLQVVPANYEKRFAKYINLFGREAVEFVHFDRNKFRNQCIITDFCDRIGATSTHLVKKNKNTSLSDEAVALLLAWNRIGKKLPASSASLKARNHLIRLLRDTFKGTFQLDRQHVLDELDAGDIEWMEKHGGFTFSNIHDDSRSPGIKSEAELLELASSSLARLRVTASEIGISSSTENPAEMLNAVYDHFLNQIPSSSL